MAERLSHTDPKEIRDKLAGILKDVLNQLMTGLVLMSKTLYLMLILVFYDAWCYLKQFISDDSFDNYFINRALFKYSKEKLIPMRKWELKEKFQLPWDKKLSRKEWRIITKIAIYPLLTLTFIIFICVADYSLGNV